MENTVQTSYPDIAILLIEDDPADALLVQEMLSEIKNSNCVLSRAERAAEALRLIASRNFDIILLDLSLPDGTGLELVRKVRSAAPQTPVIVMSGLQDEDMALKVVQEGVQDYFVKGHVDSFVLGRALRYAIERKRSEEELRRANAELSILYRISSTVSRSIDMKGLLSDVIDTMTGLDMLNLERRGAIFMVEDGRLRLVHAVGHPEGFTREHLTIKLGECHCGMAVEQGEIVISGDSHKDGCHSICLEGMLPHGHIILPLKAREKVIGVLCLYTATGTTVNAHEKKMLLSMSEQIGIAMDNARLYETTKALSLHDALTGLANRRQMDIYFERNLARAKRYGTPLTIMLLDIDHFKRYNDMHGHSAGDDLLVDMAGLMTSELRATDLVVRYGGEEFLYMLSNTDLMNAHCLAERLRQKIQDTLGVTVSIGIATYTRTLMTREDLIRRADELLYEAKKSGRNRVVSGIVV